MKNFLLLIILILSCSKLLAHATIIIEGVEHNEGYIDVKIYINNENFLKEEMAIESVRKKAVKGQNIIPLSKIHEGPFAIAVYHDENGDGKLNTGLFWRPKEGYAFSNNYTPKGPPSFKKAKILITHGEPITIRLNY
ncbi:MAG: hypothetical protein CFH21_00784 [Alphaproteobacteria bacterium MarineAlpha5_Bin11]|nr:MAG: hypothetical protein CFH21_00784 [Alphaproteobacteria bacterium MarineAlpha5_Bin11]PPR51957.1 MAG: hypothetical protein CFH20_00145 [Alphaproteobacteria bacterium MarineAlpha5_Bin10]|tara:strand:- start:1992 stop:2402 length:411 start_codon:yes stop_codon:yes gene_type:complete